VSFIVVALPPIQDEIRSWGLSIDAEDLLYKLLGEELAEGHEQKCARLSAPSPTFVYDLDFQDPCVLGITHFCTFWLTYGEQDDALYIRQCQHRQEEKWES
jgi:hypothetical protein